MTTDREPLSATDIDMMRAQLRDYGRVTSRYSSERWLATLDEARATPSGDLAAALRDFMQERMTEPHAMTPAEERLMKVARAALRSVSADSPDPLREALHRAITGGYSDESIDADLYHRDPVYHAVVWEARKHRAAIEGVSRDPDPGTWCREHRVNDQCPENCPRCGGYWHGSTDCRYASTGVSRDH